MIEVKQMVGEPLKKEILTKHQQNKIDFLSQENFKTFSRDMAEKTQKLIQQSNEQKEALKDQNYK
jgi:hypothetical protein